MDTETETQPQTLTQSAQERLKQLIERIENLIREKDEITADIRDVYLEAKATGFNVAVIKAIIKERSQDQQERAELEAVIDLYRHALGMIE